MDPEYHLYIHRCLPIPKGSKIRGNAIIKAGFTHAESGFYFIGQTPDRKAIRIKYPMRLSALLPIGIRDDRNSHLSHQQPSLPP